MIRLISLLRMRVCSLLRVIKPRDGRVNSVLEYKRENQWGSRVKSCLSLQENLFLFSSGT